MMGDEEQIMTKRRSNILPSLKVGILIGFVLILKFILSGFSVSERIANMENVKPDAFSFYLTTEMGGSILFGLLVVFVFQAGAKFRNKQARYRLFVFGMLFSCILTLENLLT